MKMVEMVGMVMHTTQWMVMLFQRMVMVVVKMIVMWVIVVSMVMVVVQRVVAVVLVCTVVACGIVAIMVMPAMGVTVAVMSMSKGCHTNDVDDQPECADGEQLSKLVDGITVYQTLQGLVDNLNAYEPTKVRTTEQELKKLKSGPHQKYAIGKASEGVHLAVAIWKSLTGRPFAHHGRAQAYHEGKTVKEHVDTVAQKT